GGGLFWSCGDKTDATRNPGGFACRSHGRDRFGDHLPGGAWVGIARCAVLDAATRRPYQDRRNFSLASQRVDSLSSDFSQMIKRDYLIIGSGIGGASVCEGIRKHDKRGSVTLVGAEELPPYKRWIRSEERRVGKVIRTRSC